MKIKTNFFKVKIASLLSGRKKSFNIFLFQFSFFFFKKDYTL